MKKQTLIIGSKAQAAILKNVDNECKFFMSQQQQMLIQIDTIDTMVGTPEKATGYTHIVWKAMVQGGRDVPSDNYTSAIQDKGVCGKYLKRLADFIRNNADKGQSRAFNPETYCKAVLNKCMEHPEVLAALAKTLPAMYAEMVAAAEAAKKTVKKVAPKKATKVSAPVVSA